MYTRIFHRKDWAPGLRLGMHVHSSKYRHAQHLFIRELLFLLKEKHGKYETTLVVSRFHWYTYLGNFFNGVQLITSEAYKWFAPRRWLQSVDTVTLLCSCCLNTQHKTPTQLDKNGALFLGEKCIFSGTDRRGSW